MNSDERLFSRLLWALMLGLLLAVLLAGCGGGGGSETSPQDNPPPTDNDDGGSGDDNGDDTGEDPPSISDDPINSGELDLSEVALDVSSAEVFDLATISGLPEGARVEDLYVEYRFAEDDWPIGPGVDDSGVAVLVQPEGMSEVYLVVPLSDADGANLKLRITDGASYSRTLSLEVAALPAPRTGAIEDLLDATEALVQTTTEAYGLVYPDDLQAYVDSPQSIDAEFIPLIRGYQALRNPDNPNSLRALELDEDEREVMERIIAHMGLIAEMEALTEYAGGEDTLIDDASPYLQSTVTQPSARNQLAQSRLFSTSTSTAATDDDAVIFDGLYEISGPEALATALFAYEQSLLAQQRVEDRAEMAGYVVTAVGVGAAFVLAGPPGAATASATAAASSAATASLALTILDVAGGAANITRGFFPCCIVAVKMQLLPESGTMAHEDEEDPSLFMEGVEATVRSDGIDLAKEVFTRAFNQLGSAKVSKKLQNDYATDKLAEELIDNAVGAGFDQLEFTGAEIVFEWSGVDISGDDLNRWVDVEHEGFGGGMPIFEQSSYQAPDIIGYRLIAENFFGNEGARDVLRIEPNRDEFRMGSWHPPIPGDSRTIEGTTINVRFEPAGIRVDAPGQVIPFKVIVTRARDTGIDLPLVLEPEIGTVVALNDGDDGIYEFEYHAPDDELPQVPVFVKTRATSTEGVRSEGDPTERPATMRISTDSVSVEIKPKAVCMEQGETQVFEAVDPLIGDPVEVTWSADLGQISSNGTYTAPGAQAPGYATVTATTEEEEDVTATAHVAFGCTCWWEGTVSGGISESHAHTITSIFLNEQGELTEFLFGARGDRVGSRVILDTAVSAGTTGSFTGRTTHPSSFGIDPTKAWRNTDISIVPEAVRPPLEVVISQHELLDPGLGRPEGSRIIEATISGGVTRWAFQNDAFVVFSGSLDISVQGNYSIVTANPQRMLNCRAP